MKIFSIDVKIVAIAYIKAETEADALAAVKGICNTGLEFPDTDLEHLETPISGRQYDDEDMPDLSLSPAMTIVGPDEGDEVSLVEDLDEEAEAA